MGDMGVGKSSIVIKFVVGSFPEECDPTIQDTYRYDRPEMGRKMNVY
jgi:GTPase SAR1 family protein